MRRLSSLLVLALTLAACSSDETTQTVEAYTPEASGEAEPSDAERGIAAYIADNYGVDLTVIECPELSATEIILCATEAEGIAFETAVSPSEGGNSSIVPVGFVTRHAMEKVAVMFGRRTYSGDLSAACDMPTATRTPVGETVECAVSEPDGTEHTYEIRFDDDRGDINVSER